MLATGRYRIDTWLTLGSPLGYTQELQAKLRIWLDQLGDPQAIALAEGGAKFEEPATWIGAQIGAAKQQIDAFFHGLTPQRSSAGMCTVCQHLAFPEWACRSLVQHLRRVPIRCGAAIFWPGLTNVYLSGGRQRVYDVAITNPEIDPHSEVGYLEALQTAWLVRASSSATLLELESEMRMQIDLPVREITDSTFVLAHATWSVARGLEVLNHFEADTHHRRSGSRGETSLPVHGRRVPRRSCEAPGCIDSTKYFSLQRRCERRLAEADDSAESAPVRAVVHMGGRVIGFVDATQPPSRGPTRSGGTRGDGADVPPPRQCCRPCIDGGVAQ